MRSCWKAGLTATVVVVQRWAGSRVTLMLSLMGRIRVSSLFPQYLITAMFVGVWAVTINAHFFSSAIDSDFRRRRKRGSTSTISGMESESSSSDSCIGSLPLLLFSAESNPSSLPSNMSSAAAFSSPEWLLVKGVVSLSMGSDALLPETKAPDLAWFSASAIGAEVPASTGDFSPGCLLAS
nr:hypothetical protein Iba_chr11fCG10410 [Ipomoea batatas]